MTRLTSDLLKSAQRLFRSARFDEAEAGYRDALQAGAKEALLGLAEVALLRNRPGCAAGHLARFARSRRWMAGVWPFSLAEATLRGMVHYRANHLAAASRSFRAAAGPLPVGPLRDLVALARWLEVFKDSAPYLVDPLGASIVDMLDTEPLPLIQVQVNGRERCVFFLDSGAAEVILDRELARFVGVPLYSEVRGESAGPVGQIALGRLETLRVGALEIANLPVHVLDASRFASVFPGREVRGAIGTRLLMQFLPTIDYARGRFQLAPRPPVPAEPDTLGRGVPFWVAQSHYLITHGRANGGPPMALFIDTGVAGKGFTGTPRALADLGVTPNWEAASPGAAGFGPVKSFDFDLAELTLGEGSEQIVRRNLPAVALDPPLAVLGSRLGFDLPGCVSHSFFRNAALTLDFSAMRMVVSPR